MEDKGEGVFVIIKSSVLVRMFQILIKKRSKYIKEFESVVKIIRKAEKLRTVKVHSSLRSKRF